MADSFSSSVSLPCTLSDYASVPKITNFDWKIDLVWRTRSWKDVPVHFDCVSGKLHFCKPESEVIFHSRKLERSKPEQKTTHIFVVNLNNYCYGVQESFDEQLVILHTLDISKTTDSNTSTVDHYFCYFVDDSEMDRFKIVLANALRAVQRRKRFLVILNRESGGGRAGHVYDETVKPMLFAASCTHVLKVSEYNRHISLFGSQLDKTGIDGVILIGGDGTVNEFLNGLFSRRDWSSLQAELPITLVPCGVKLQLAARFGVGDASLAVFSALRGRCFSLFPIAFVQARRRFYGHSYLQICPAKRTYFKFYYLNSLPPLLAATATATNDSDTEMSLAASSVDSIVSKGPQLRFYSKFLNLQQLGKDVSHSTIVIGSNADLQLSNTFDPAQTHPLALMSQTTKLNPVQRLWHSITCRKAPMVTGSTTSLKTPAATPASSTSSIFDPILSGSTDFWPKMLAMTRAGFLEIEDTVAYPPSQNKDRWFVDGEIIATESVYFESMDVPVKLTIPPEYLLEE
jgi:hypothetical protein